MDLTSTSKTDGLNTPKQQQTAALPFSLRGGSQEISLKQHSNCRPVEDLQFFLQELIGEKKAALEKNTRHLNA